MLIALLGPTGIGKSVAISGLTSQYGLTYIVPDTTRPQRPGESDKNHICNEVFDDNVARHRYGLVTELFNYRYGTPIADIKAAIREPNPTHLLDFPREYCDELISWGGHTKGLVLWVRDVKILTGRLTKCGRSDRIPQAIQQYEEYDRWLPTLGNDGIIDYLPVSAEGAPDEVIADIAARLDVTRWKVS